MTSRNGTVFAEINRDFEIISKLNIKWLNISSASPFTSFNLDAKWSSLEKNLLREEKFTVYSNNTGI